MLKDARGQTCVDFVERVAGRGVAAYPDSRRPLDPATNAPRGEAPLHVLDDSVPDRLYRGVDHAAKLVHRWPWAARRFARVEQECTRGDADLRRGQAHHPSLTVVGLTPRRRVQLLGDLDSFGRAYPKRGRHLVQQRCVYREQPTPVAGLRLLEVGAGGNLPVRRPPLGVRWCEPGFSVVAELLMGVTSVLLRPRHVTLDVLGAGIGPTVWRCHDVARAAALHSGSALPLGWGDRRCGMVSGCLARGLAVRTAIRARRRSRRYACSRSRFRERPAPSARSRPAR